MSDIVTRMRAEYPLHHPRSVSLEIAMDVHALCDEIDRLREERRQINVAALRSGTTEGLRSRRR